MTFITHYKNVLFYTIMKWAEHAMHTCPEHVYFLMSESCLFTRLFNDTAYKD